MSKVTLAIRVRPFSERELKSEKDRIPVVNVADKHTVTITNTKVSVSGAGDSRERTRRYYADYTFDSSSVACLPCYASQEKVFETIGREVLDCISRGSSACVMAYGQSATGKTHTMMGTDAQPGLVPRLCRALADLQPFEITVSFLEIYNERVHDLLVGEAAPACHSLPRRRGNARKDLRVREHPSKGPYVQNLRRVAVHDVETLLSLVSEGTRRRHTAATRRNSTSSRSHALLEIASPHATLHLADLAGSEKASWEGCGGGRQKEGANINKSLVALSNVISALVNCGNGPGRFVPYRDSALTWLLKDCFTGGASTFIIATVSPSIACYGESASTLRWAERARQLPTPKSTTTGPNHTSKVVLQAQFSQLIAELARNYIRYIPETGKIFYDEHHWDLPVNKESSEVTLNTETKIGNIMNRLNPTPDTNNSNSSVLSAASGSSDIINTMDKNIKIVDEINKEVDKLFAPNLERTSSSIDLKVVAPLRHKKRQYRSQEVLPLDEVLTLSHNSMNSLPSSNQTPTNEQTDKTKPHVAILHDSQRAEIVASVTERLYTKLKKKEEVAGSKMESVVDKKNMEPLSELRICTNARQRLIELSQKAMRNKRRIGIPAYTQTRLSVIRVKDQAVDVQTDLESYVMKNQHSFTLYRDVGTETMPMTPRCKEIAVGSKYGTLKLSDSSTLTDSKKVVYKNSSIMTDECIKCDRFTQSPIVPPPRRKKRALNMAKIINNEDRYYPEESLAPVISINISQPYPFDSESQSSDDNSEVNFTEFNNISKTMTTPDLLTNHCDAPTGTNKMDDQDMCIEVTAPKSKNPNSMCNSTDSLESIRQSGEFPHADDYCLPKVTVDSVQKTNCGEMKNMILGRNESIYPYNIILSPAKEKDYKRIVTFKDIDVAHAINVASQTDWDTDDNLNTSNKDTKLPCNVDVSVENNNAMDESTCSDSTDASKVETDSFIWKKGNDSSETLGRLRRTNYVPVYKSKPRYNTARGRFYREFFSLDDVEKVNKRYIAEEISNNYSSSDSTELYSNYRNQHKNNERDYPTENNRKSKDMFDDVERKIVESCKQLEISANDYDNYSTNYHITRREDRRGHARTPTAYLQHLVNLRRKMVRAEDDTTD